MDEKKQHSPNWGGKRPGAGRPTSRNATAKVRSVYGSDSEHAAVKRFLKLYRAYMGSDGVCKDSELRGVLGELRAADLLQYFDGLETFKGKLPQEKTEKLF